MHRRCANNHSCGPARLHSTGSDIAGSPPREFYCADCYTYCGIRRASNAPPSSGGPPLSASRWGFSGRLWLPACSSSARCRCHTSSKNTATRTPPSPPPGPAHPAAPHQAGHPRCRRRRAPSSSSSCRKAGTRQQSRRFGPCTVVHIHTCAIARLTSLTSPRSGTVTSTMAPSKQASGTRLWRQLLAPSHVRSQQRNKQNKPL